ncbi:hypothetical Protein YC6258_04326 [Gynuella sunshinyii YC6258]|uniref:Uncharacterized protein n=1 Tax=Gynuella sunshinyii YC6258 TaxID=1445510 RepID=A0A0C5VAK6_9GAMM|nr:hypothetical Protein YC6258_04326 [Gynuella sunshinyii YC6258]
MQQKYSEQIFLYQTELNTGRLKDAGTQTSENCASYCYFERP